MLADGSQASGLNIFAFSCRVLSYFVTRNRISSSILREGPLMFVCEAQTGTNPAQHLSLPLTLK
jgi:hypothetical protein